MLFAKPVIISPVAVKELKESILFRIKGNDASLISKLSRIPSKLELHLKERVLLNSRQPIFSIVKQKTRECSQTFENFPLNYISFRHIELSSGTTKMAVSVNGFTVTIQKLLI